MADNIMEVVIQLRKDTELNFAKVAHKFIPADGEVCLVETTDFGIKTKIGNGVDYIGDLPYAEDGQAAIMGYYNSQYDCFFKEQTETNIIPAAVNTLYIDIPSSEVYHRLPDHFEKIISVAKVDLNKAGLTKLYSGHGNNVDGAVTQKGFTNAIDEIKFKVSVEDSECLELNKPW